MYYYDAHGEKYKFLLLYSLLLLYTKPLLFNFSKNTKNETEQKNAHVM